MPKFWADFTRTVPLPAIEVAAAGVCLALGILVSRHFRTRLSAEELEKRRRQATNQRGKLGDGEIIDIDGTNLFYSYSVAGVGYTTSQDIAALESLLPADRSTLLGPVSIKYLTSNPPNSIILCEDWSGLRFREVASRR